MRFVCITGPDGAGKTTQIVKLAERLERQGKLAVRCVTIWDLLLDPATKHHVPFRSPAEVDRYLEILGPTSRALFLFHCLYQAMDLARKKSPDVCLVNAYWYKYYATEVAHGADPQLLMRMAQVFEEPEVTLYLRVSPEVAFARKAALSGYETGFAQPRSKEAFLAFQERSLRALDEVASKRSWIRLDGSEPAELLSERILFSYAKGNPPE